MWCGLWDSRARFVGRSFCGTFRLPLLLLAIGWEAVVILYRYQLSYLPPAPIIELCLRAFHALNRARICGSQSQQRVLDSDIRGPLSRAYEARSMLSLGRCETVKFAPLCTKPIQE